jgi:hypothetical protein
MDDRAAVVLNGVFKTKRLTMSFLWKTRRFALCADRTLRRYDGDRLRHSAAITPTTRVAKVGDTEFTVTFMQPDLCCHIRAASSAERDTWVAALTDAALAAGAVTHGNSSSSTSSIPLHVVLCNASKMHPSPVTHLRVMPTTISDWCLERHSSASHDDSGILSDVARLCFLVHYALFFPPLSLRQRIPTPGQLTFPPKLLRRFLRGCAVATAHALVTPPASVSVTASTKIIWSKRIFARVMRVVVMREEMLLHAAASSRIAAAARIEAARWAHMDIIDNVGAATARGDVADVLSYLIANPNCVNERSR